MIIKTRIPSEEECLTILHEYKILPNILEHSKQVKNVSLIIIDNLKDNSYINRELVIAAALLHDITKTLSIRTGDLKHDITGGNILREMGYNKIADIVESHIILRNFKPEGKLEEREIVHYADKRVLHDKIATIHERMDDLIKRYSKSERDENFIREHMKTVIILENKVQKHLKIDIDKFLSSL